MRGVLVMLLASCRALRPAALRFAARRRSGAALTTMSAAPPRKKVKSIVEVTPDSVIGETVTVKGWARTVRAQKALGFLEVNDGSSFGGLQVVFEGDLVSSLKGVGTGCAVSIEGEVVKGGGKQPIELKASSFELVGGCEGDYPLQKKRHSLEFLRSIAHLRPRTNTLAAAARIRSTLAQAVHAFFDEEGFNYVHSPIITTSDCEGAGEMFRVTSLDGKELSGSAEKNDFAEDFFARSAYLTVSGQLSGEAYACALGDVYTFGPTFRAENSQTARHLAEFWMIEPEIAFADAAGAVSASRGAFTPSTRLVSISR
jgi:asparaginyl-tRNA synthetase